jgi:hypothetical protein
MPRNVEDQGVLVALSLAEDGLKLAQEADKPSNRR